MRAGMLIVSMIIISHAVWAADPEPAKVDALFANIAPSSPGAAVVVIKDGRAVFQRGYGVTDLRTLHRIDEHTNFRLASVTKQFTAMAVMLLVQDGKLRYDESLTEIFPEFPAYGKTITVRHLLNHTSGLLDYEDLMAKQYGNTPDDQIPQIHDAGVLTLLEKATTTNFPAGTRWQYSNSGYCVLAMVVEKVSGQPFGQFLHDRIFAPLQMKNTVAYVERRASPPAGRARTPVSPLDPGLEPVLVMFAIAEYNGWSSTTLPGDLQGVQFGLSFLHADPQSREWNVAPCLSPALRLWLSRLLHGSGV